MTYNKNTVIILDNGHGCNTSGKCSPIWSDGSQLKEWASNRDLVSRIAAKFDALGVKYKILVPEDKDISLTTRVARANKIYTESGKNAFLLSIHSNAGVKPNQGKGWCAYTTPGKTKSDEIATVMYKYAEKYFPDEKMRKDMSDGDPDQEANFYIIKNTSCPAVLSENFFMDTESECKKILMNDDARDKIAQLHVDAVKELLGF